MRGVTSLSNRIFLACAVLAILSLGLAFSFVNARAAAEAEEELRTELTEAAAVVDENRAFLVDTFTRLSRLVADLPKLKGAVDTGDPPTVQPLAADYRRLVGADLLVVSDSSGRLLAADGLGQTVLPLAPGSRAETSMLLADSRGILQMVGVPILLGLESSELLGRLTFGFYLDDRLAARLEALTDSEIAFAAGGRIVASSLSAEVREPLRAAIGTADISSVTLDREEYLVLSRPLLEPQAAAGLAADQPHLLVLRSRTERLRFLNTLRTGLTGALVVTVLLAVVLSYAVARTMTRPLAAVTGAMRELAATGDLTRKVPVRRRAWDDEDARLLASTFNTLTESIARFQREAGQRERLSSLGRLSTVVAHEIRNPLIIIWATRATLRRARMTPELRAAIADIDGETTRLNRLVTDVLDFARPIRFELVPTSVNDVCRDSAMAARTNVDGDNTPIELDLFPGLPPAMLDGERLRTALVNILTNARIAVLPEPNDSSVIGGQGTGAARGASAVAARSSVRLQSRLEGNRIVIVVSDSGPGIPPEHLVHVFDPYFTTRRGGTGLGLPIAKNIVEGLGGTIAARSEPGAGTEIRVELTVGTDA
jgi:signal transduction histidine kinase